MTEGTRSNLWGAMRTAIETIRPQYAVIENVRGLLSATANSDLESCPGCVGDTEHREHTMRALGRVLGDLADLGYDAQWHGLRAADIGAPHGRYRIFVIATDARRIPNATGRISTPRQTQGGRSLSELIGRSRTQAPAHPKHDGQSASPVGGSDGTTAQERARAGRVTEVNDGQPTGRHLADRRPGHLQRPETTAYPESSEWREQESDGLASTPGSASELGERSSGDVATNWGPYEPAIRRWERVLGRPAPAPTELSAKGKHQLSPVFVEWMMGLNEGHVTGIDGISRSDQLKMLGNGVVPQQALAALQVMTERMHHVEAALVV